MEMADVPTIEQILEEYDVVEYLPGYKYTALLDALRERDSLMRTDAAKYQAEKALKLALNSLCGEE